MKLIIVSQELVLDGADGPRGLGFLAADNLLSADLPYPKIVFARPITDMDNSLHKYSCAKPWITDDNRASLQFMALPGVRGLQSLLAFPAAFQAMARAISPGDTVILRNLGWMQWIGYWAAKRKKAKIAVQLLGAYDKNIKTGSSSLWNAVHRLVRSYEKRILRQADAVALVSPWLQSSYDISPQEVKHLSILPDSTLTAEWLQPTPKAFSKKLELIYVGRLEEAKGLATLLEAVQTAQNNGISYHLHLVGTGSMDASIREWISLHGLHDSITLHGFQSGHMLQRLYDSCHAFVFPSCSEGLPLVILEGMARSKAFIVSDIAAHRELFTEGQNALLFTPGDAAQLAERIQQLAADETLYLKMAKSAHEGVQEYLLPRILSKWEGLLQHIHSRASAGL